MGADVTEPPGRGPAPASHQLCGAPESRQLYLNEKLNLLCLMRSAFFALKEEALAIRGCAFPGFVRGVCHRLIRAQEGVGGGRGPPSRERAVTAPPLVSRTGSLLCAAPSSDVMVLYPCLRSGSVLNGGHRRGREGRQEKQREKERDTERGLVHPQTRGGPGASACHTWEPGA